MHDVREDGPNALSGENHVFGNNTIRSHYETENGTPLTGLRREMEESYHRANAVEMATRGGAARPGSYDFESRLRDASLRTGAHPAELRETLQGYSESSHSRSNPEQSTSDE